MHNLNVVIQTMYFGLIHKYSLCISTSLIHECATSYSLIRSLTISNSLIRTSLHQPKKKTEYELILLHRIFNTSIIRGRQPLIKTACDKLAGNLFVLLFAFH